MITYICLGTHDLQRAVRFYDPVMAALGHARCRTPGEEDFGDLMGWGSYNDHGAHEVALWLGKPFDGGPPSSGNGTMVAFRATSWTQVDAFHEAAVTSGGSSEGAPGLRPQYNPDFYAAYVRDPDGNKLAAVCRGFVTRQTHQT
jgi:catechol 2,3-dioxygenase-like lactoylglutathione lyase family enzyme